MSDNESVEENTRKTSAQRYILNIIVRLLFFFGIYPVLLLFSADTSNIDIIFKLPYGMLIFVTCGVIGAILDILLPKNSVIGGKLVIWAFNFSTLTWFEGLEFNVSVNAGFQGKGVSIKDERE